MAFSDRTAEDILAVFGRVFGGRSCPFTLHYRSFSGRAVHRRSCRSCAGALLMRADCAHCRGGSYRPLDGSDILNHINGRAAVGIYPADENGLCRFSVLEIGGHAPAKLLVPLIETCEALGAACLPEVYQGGQSARLWVFFGKAIPAREALMAGLRVISEAGLMGELHRISLLPTAGRGYGRPAVLPLYDFGGGSSFFLDKELEPIDDPLSLLENLAPAEAKFTPKKPALPKKMKAELCGQLYVPLAQLKGDSAAELMRACCFPEPDAGEFNTTSALTHLFSVTAGRLILPGALDLRALLPNVRLRLTDSRTRGRRLRLKASEPLSPWQSEAFAAVLRAGGGVVTAPLGSGKTAVARALLAKYGRTALILTPDRVTAERWKRLLIEGFSLKERAVGLVLNDGDFPTGRIDVAVLNRDAGLRLTETVSGYGTVMLADCDRLSCTGQDFCAVMDAVCAKNVFAISARPIEGARLGDYIRLYVGKTVYSLAGGFITL